MVPSGYDPECLILVYFVWREQSQAGNPYVPYLSMKVCIFLPHPL